MRSSRATLAHLLGPIAAATLLAAVAGCAGETGPSSSPTAPTSATTPDPTTPSTPTAPTAPSTPETPTTPSTPAPSTPAPSPPTTPGTGTCANIFDCMDACSDTACEQQCVNSGTAQAQTQAQALATCEDSAYQACQASCADPQSETCYQCVDPRCQAQATACFGADGGTTPTTPTTPTGTGTQTCGQMLSCFEACADATCDQGCLDQGTAAAQQQLQALEQCEDQAEAGTCATQCAGTDDNACYQCLDQACAAQLAACQ